MARTFKLTIAITCTAALAGGWVGMHAYLSARDRGAVAPVESAPTEPYLKPRYLPGPEIMQTQAPAAAADTTATNVRPDPEHPLKLGPDYYPPAAKRAREQGRCVVQITVLPDGHISAARLQVSSGFPRLDLACLRAVRDGQMLPATEDDQPVEKTTSLPIVWKLTP